MQSPVFGKRDIPLPPRNGKENAFMDWAKSRILSVDNHPLSFLINPTTKDWYSRKSSRNKHAVLNEHHPPVQPGHIFTRARLGDISQERFCLQDADDNYENGISIELHGFAVQIVAVEVGGVPVEIGTAEMWERTGMLATSSPSENRMVSPGWSCINDPK